MDPSNPLSTKWSKKLKAFFDDKIKVKHRLHALETFYEGATEEEAIALSKDYPELCFTVISDGYDRLVGKIKGRGTIVC